jgi:hypothetical protein
MTTKLPGKSRFMLGAIVVVWGLIAPESVPGWIVGSIVGLGAFLAADGLWAALEAK